MLVPENLLQRHLLDRAQGLQEAQVQVGGIAEDGIHVGAALDPLGVGGKEVVHREGTDFLIDLLLAGLGEAELLGGQVAVQDGGAGGALGAELAQDGGFRDLQVLGGLRQVFDDFVEALDSLLELVVLGGDVGPEGIGVTLEGRGGETGAGTVGEGAGFPHFLEHDRVHAATVILVEQGDGWILREVHGFAPVGVLHIIELTGVVRGQDDLGGRGELLDGVRLHERLQAFAGMDVSHHLLDFLDRGGAVVEKGHLLAQQVLHGAGQGIRGERSHGGVVQRLRLDILRTVDQVGLQGAVAGTLVQFGVHPGADQVLLEFGKDFFVAGGIAQQVFHDREGLGEILAEAGHIDVGGIPAHLEAVAAGEGIHFGGDVGSGMLRCSEIVEIAGGQSQDRIVVTALVIADGEGRDVVLVVLLVQERQSVYFGDGHVLFVVHEDRLDRRDLSGSDAGEEIALLVAVGHDRRDAWGVDLLDGLVLADVLVGSGVAVGAQVFLRPGDDVGLGDLRDPVHLPHGRLPRHPVDEGIHELVGPAAVGNQSLHLAEFVVGLGGLHERFGEVTVAEFGELGEDDVADLFQGLSLLGHAFHDHETVVSPVVVEDSGAQDGLVLVDVQVDETGLPVIEDGGHDVGNLALQRGSARRAPAHHQELGVIAHDVLAEGSGDRILRPHGEGREILVGFPGAEVFLDGLDHLVRVEVTGEADGHVVRDIVGVLLLADGLQGRVLQVVLRADDGLGAVRVVREEHRVEGVERLLGVVGQAHVLLLVHGLELGVEAAEDAVLEAVGLDLRPVLELVGGDFLHVAGHVVGGVGVGTAGADDGHELVILVRDRDLGRLLADGVDLVVKVQAGLRVRQGAVHLEQAVDGREQGLLGLVVLRAELLGALEHHVLQVVGETGVVSRVVLAACADGHQGLDAGLVLVDAHVHGKSVLQGVDLRIERIARNGLVLGAAGGGHGGQGRQEKDSLHIYLFEWANLHIFRQKERPRSVSAEPSRDSDGLSGRGLFRPVLQNVARLAVEGAADGFHRGNPDGLRLAALEDGQVRGGDAHFFRQLAGGHLPPREHDVDIDDDRHYFTSSWTSGFLSAPLR